MAAAVIDILDAERHEPLIRTWAYIGRDFTASTFKMQIRQHKNTTGTPFVNTSSDTGGVYSPYQGTATVSAHVAAGRLLGVGENNIYTMINPNTGNNYLASDSLLLSQVRINVDVLTMEGIPTGPSVGIETGDELTCWYDIIKDPAAAPEVIQKGRLVVLGGVTIR